MRKPAIGVRRPNFSSKRFRRLLGLFTTLFWELDDIRLLIALIHLNAQDRWRGRWLFGLALLLYRMNRWSRSGNWSSALVQPFGIGGFHRILMGVDGIAQDQLNLAFGTGESKTF